MDTKLTPPKNECAEFAFGAIADVQYADTDDGYNFDKTQKRFYRRALTCLATAVDSWNEIHANVQPLSFVAQLGDVIDGKCAKEGKTMECLQSIEQQANRCAVREWHHLVGNHELYNFPRTQFHEAPAFLKDTYSYHEFSPHPNWRVICLDAYDTAVIGWKDSNSQRVVDAWNILKTHNPNDCTKPVDWLAGLDGIESRFVPYGGGIGPEQLAWFEQQLTDARTRNQRVIVMTHVPLCPGAACDDCILWNYAEVLDVLDRFRGVVVAVFAGHAHRLAARRTRSGVHHITLRSPLDALGPDGTCHSTVVVFPSELHVHGAGFEPSGVYKLEPTA